MRRQHQLLATSNEDLVPLIDSLRQVYHDISASYVATDQTPSMTGPELRLDSLTDQADRYEAALAKGSTDDPTLYQQPIDYCQKLKEALPPRTALIEYLKFNSPGGVMPDDMGQPYYLAVVVTDWGTTHSVFLPEAREIDSLIAAFKQHMLLVSMVGLIAANDTQEYHAISSNLYRLVWQPIEKYLDSAHTVLVSPAAGLNLISFAALSDSTQSYLLDRYTVAYLTAARDLLRPGQSASSGTGLLALGDPDFDATPEQRLAARSTPATEAEPDWPPSRNRISSTRGPTAIPVRIGGRSPATHPQRSPDPCC